MSAGACWRRLSGTMTTVAAPQYGNQHQLARRRAIAALRSGQPCPMCGAPMYGTPAAALAAGLLPAFGTLHLDHAVPVMMGGAGGVTRLVHARCNTWTGGLLGAVITNARAGHPVGSSARRRRRRALGSPGAPAQSQPRRYDWW